MLFYIFGMRCDWTRKGPLAERFLLRTREERKPLKLGRDSQPVMKIGVLSDSHGEAEGLERAAKLLNEIGADVLIHLGDDSADAKALEKHRIKVIKVPGVFEPAYEDPSIPNRLIEQFEGWKVLITHTSTSHPNDLEDDLKPEELIEKHEVDVVLYGHTHIPKIDIKGGILLLNPGHLKKQDKKGFPPTFGLLDLEKEEISTQIMDFEGKQKFRKALRRSKC